MALKLRPLCGKAEAEVKGIPRFLATARDLALYNADALLAGPPRVLVCEGESDTLVALAAGAVAVGVPGARAFKAAWAEAFRGVAGVVLCFDPDTAGREGLAQVVSCFKAAGLAAPRVLRLPEGRDLADVLKPDDPPELSPDVETLARALSGCCFREPGRAIPAAEIEQAAKLGLHGNERREVWRTVKNFYATNKAIIFGAGAVAWRERAKGIEA